MTKTIKRKTVDELVTSVMDGSRTFRDAMYLAGYGGRDVKAEKPMFAAYDYDFLEAFINKFHQIARVKDAQWQGEFRAENPEWEILLTAIG